MGLFVVCVGRRGFQCLFWCGFGNESCGLFFLRRFLCTECYGTVVALASVAVFFKGFHGAVVSAVEKLLEFRKVERRAAAGVEVDGEVGAAGIGNGVAHKHHGKRAVGHRDDVVAVFVLGQ